MSHKGMKWLPDWKHSSNVTKNERMALGCHWETLWGWGEFRKQQRRAGMSRRPGDISTTLATPSAAVWPPEVDKTCHVEFHVQPAITCGEKKNGWFQNRKTKGCTIKYFSQKVRGRYYIANKRHKDKERTRVGRQGTNKHGSQSVYLDANEKSLEHSQPRTWRRIHADRAGKVGSCGQAAHSCFGGKNAGKSSRERRGCFSVICRHSAKLLFNYLNFFVKKWLKGPL